jgi:hypothetical protein
MVIEGALLWKAARGVLEPQLPALEPALKKVAVGEASG